MNPALAVPAQYRAVVQLWLRCREFGGGMGGRALPGPGGVGDQPAALMDAFRALDGMMAEEQ